MELLELVRLLRLESHSREEHSLGNLSERSIVWDPWRAELGYGAWAGAAAVDRGEGGLI